MPRTKISSYFIARIKSFDTERLREVKDIVIKELSDRDIQNDNSKVQGRLYKKITWGRYHGYDYEERLKYVAETYTEKQFSEWNGIGKTTLAFAKQELEKRGLKFKEDQKLKELQA